MSSSARDECTSVAPTFEDAPGIHRIVLPTPWVRTVNVYLLEGSPLTLFDTGPGLTASTALLRNTLERLGRRLADIELVVISHQHFDHMGAARFLVESSGAEVACFAPAAAFIADYRKRADAEDDWLADVMLRHGVPPGTVTAARAFARLQSYLAEPVRVTRPLHDGDVLGMGGRSMRVMHRPGHSPSDIVVHDAEGGLLLSGDHLLSRISSNALLAQPLDRPAPAGSRPEPLLDYRRSLQATRTLDASLVLPGHGEPFPEVAEIIDRHVVRHEERCTKLLTLLRDHPRSAFALARAIWGAEASGQVHLVLSEVLGHLDLLVRAGDVDENRDDDVVVFSAVA